MACLRVFRNRSVRLKGGILGVAPLSHAQQICREAHAVLARPRPSFYTASSKGGFRSTLPMLK